MTLQELKQAIESFADDYTVCIKIRGAKTDTCIELDTITVEEDHIGNKIEIAF
jgi:hypothetical protein